MALLTDGEITAMRATMLTSLPGTAVIHSSTTVSDGQGGNTQTYTPSGTVSCRLSPRPVATGQEDVRGDRVATVADRFITLPHTTTVLPTDRIVVESRTYEVTAVREPRSWQLHTRVDAVEID